MALDSLLLPTNRLLSERELAPLLCVSVKTLQRWRWERRGPTYRKLGSAVRYDPGDVRAFLETGRRETAATKPEAV